MKVIPHEGERMETGPVQFGDDWPGVFIRGDNALAFAMYVRGFVNLTEDPMQKAVLRGLADTLESCRVE